MFISVLDLFKIGIGPSSSHTMGPMSAANVFREQMGQFLAHSTDSLNYRAYCVLKGSLAFTGRGHATDKAVALGLHGYNPISLAEQDVNALTGILWTTETLQYPNYQQIRFIPDDDIVFDKSNPLPQHPNAMIFSLLDERGRTVLTETYFSIGGGFICTLAEIDQLNAPLKIESTDIVYPYPFDSADSMLAMSRQSGLSIAEMKRENELARISASELDQGLDSVWRAMYQCVEKGLAAEGRLPGGLKISRRAKKLFQQLQAHPERATLNDWLCAYAMAVNEENAAGHMVVTAPTNGAAGVIPAIIYNLLKHENGTTQQVRDFLLVAAAVGGIIKHRSSISGAEVGCQGEVGSAAAMAAAGLCAVRGGTTEQIENAAEIALEHHLGMTCDPVAGLVQVPCIERNGFGAIKAHTAAALACRGDGQHFMPLDSCIAAMKQTGMEMSHKFKETSLGGLAVSVRITEC